MCRGRVGKLLQPGGGVKNNLKELIGFKVSFTYSISLKKSNQALLSPFSEIKIDFDRKYKRNQSVTKNPSPHPD